MIEIEHLKRCNLGMSNDEVKLAVHDPLWSKAFNFIEPKIKEQLTCGIELHHVGSTSIPNISAKPILDILGIVDSLEEFDQRQSEVESLGFTWMGEYGIPTRRYCPLYDESKNISLVHMHVFERGNLQIESHIVFAEYLKAVPDDAKAYEKLKMDLTAAVGSDRGKYTNGKFDFIAGILKKAFIWKNNSISIGLEKRSNFPMAQDFYKSVGYLQPINPSDVVVSAYDGTKIIGVVRLALEDGKVVLRGMMIAPSHQRCGIGTKMLKELEKHIGQNDCLCLPHGWLEGFYGQIGFKKIADDEAPAFLHARVKDGRSKYPQLIVMRRDGSKT